MRRYVSVPDKIHLSLIPCMSGDLVTAAGTCTRHGGWQRDNEHKDHRIRYTGTNACKHMSETMREPLRMHLSMEHARTLPNTSEQNTISFRVYQEYGIEYE